MSDGLMCRNKQWLHCKRNWGAFWKTNSPRSASPMALKNVRLCPSSIFLHMCSHCWQYTSYLTKPFPSFKIYPPYKRVFSILLSYSYNTDVIQLAYQYINCNCPVHCCYCYCYSILWRWVIKASLHSRRQEINLYLLDGNIYIHICICM